MLGLHWELHCPSKKYIWHLPPHEVRQWKRNSVGALEGMVLHFPLLYCVCSEIMEVGGGTQKQCVPGTTCLSDRKMPGCKSGLTCIRPQYLTHHTSLQAAALFGSWSFTCVHRNIFHFLGGMLMAKQNPVADLEPLPPAMKGESAKREWKKRIFNNGSKIQLWPTKHWCLLLEQWTFSAFGEKNRCSFYSELKRFL